MITYIKGEIIAIEENKIIIDYHGMGFQVFMPGSSLDSSSLCPGMELKVHTYLYVKEDAMQLYGFLTRDDLDIFILLIGVNGIGPKGALGILSALSADALRFAVLADDAQAIAKAPGIGKKTAQKLILELKDKLNLQDAFEQTFTNREASLRGAAADKNNAQKEAVSALVALGYSNSEAFKAVKKVSQTGDMEVEELLKQALKVIAL